MLLSRSSAPPLQAVVAVLLLLATDAVGRIGADEAGAVSYEVTARRLAGAPFFRNTSSFARNFNAAAFELPDGGKGLAVRSVCGAKCRWPCHSPRCAGREDDISVITFARLVGPRADGSVDVTPITNESVILSPAVFDGPADESCGVEDPRVVFVRQTKTYYMTYTCFACGITGYNLCMATCSGNPADATCWQRHGRVFPLDGTKDRTHPFGKNSTKSGSLLVMPHGPPHYLFYYFNAEIATTTDFVHFIPTGKTLVPSKPNTSQAGVEPGPEPMRLSDGNYLYLFMGTCHPGRVGCNTPTQNRANTSIQHAPSYVILNGTDPTHVIHRASAPLLIPQEPWEVGSRAEGWDWEEVPGVIFVEGWWRLAAPDSFLVAFGCADSVVGFATINVSMIVKQSREQAMKIDDDDTVPVPGAQAQLKTDDSPATVAVTVTVDITSEASGGNLSPFPHFWEEVFGSGHGALTLRSDWQRAATQAVRELGLKAVRFHGLFDEDMHIVTAMQPGSLNTTGPVSTPASTSCSTSG